jgi:hypothetical protein
VIGNIRQGVGSLVNDAFPRARGRPYRSTDQPGTDRAVPFHNWRQWLFIFSSTVLNLTAVVKDFFHCKNNQKRIRVVSE